MKETIVHVIEESEATRSKMKIEEALSESEEGLKELKRINRERERREGMVGEKKEKEEESRRLT